MTRPGSDALRAKRDKALKLIRQDDCPHEDVYSSSVNAGDGVFSNAFCWECGKTWRTEESE